MKISTAVILLFALALSSGVWAHAPDVTQERGAGRIITRVPTVASSSNSHSTRVPPRMLRSKGASLTNAQIEAAFAADGFNVVAWHTYENGRGCRAESTNATTLDTGLPKYALYLEGTGYEMGYLTGYLAPNETEQMATTYINEILPELVSPELARKAATSKYWKGIYDAVITLLGDFVTTRSQKSFITNIALFPAELVDEMRGIADGANAANNTPGKVQFERMITLNYGIDFLLAHVYRGSILGKLRLGINGLKVSDTVKKGVRALLADDQKEIRWFKSPYMCDAFGIKNTATAEGKTYFARDFQMPVGMVFQDTANLIIYIPSDGRFSSVASSAPGFVGQITGYSEVGLAMGVDVLRTGYTNPDLPGLNSILLVRHIIDRASNTQEAITMATNAPRGCSWLYPTCDKSGDCVIMESGKFDNETAPSTLQYVKDKRILKLLPSQEELNNVTGNMPWRMGMFARTMDYQYPTSFLKYNQALFEFEGQGQYFNASGFGGPGTFVYQTWQQENAIDKKIMANYFPPLRETSSDIIVTSNLAIVPRMRVTEMSNVADFVYRGSHAVQWRYDKLLQLIHEGMGKTDFEGAKELITFLSPDRTPGYWNVTLDPTNPMSALIEGSISVVDFDTTVFVTKTGYWADNWVGVTLKSYLAPSNNEDHVVRK